MYKAAQEADDGYLAVGITDKQTSRHISQYMLINQKKRVLQTLGMPAFILLDHYYWKSGVGSFNFSDAFVSEELGLPFRTVQVTRLKLIRNGWVHQFVYRHPSVKPTRITLIGEELIRRYKKNSNTLTDTLAKIFKEAMVDTTAER